jgi:STE24 endopeptidase
MFRYLLLVAALSVSAATAQTPPPPSTPKSDVKTYTLPPEKLQKAIEYADARNRLYFISAAYGFLLFVGILATRLGPRFRDFAEIVTRRRIAQAYVFTALLAITADTLTLPVSLYDHHLSLKFEQSVQGWGSWFRDWAMGELIECLLAGVLVWILYGIIRRSSRRWWLYFWLASIPIVIFLLFITPVLIEPLFFQFQPLAARNPALVAEIGKVVARGGLEIPPGRMFEMKASEKLKSLNADVEGLGASKRVVVWDTTIRKMNTAQILFVFGHEMGHYVLGHNWILIEVNCVMILLFLFLGYHAMNWSLRRWGTRWSIRGIDDWASLPVLLLAVGIFSFIAQPVMSSFSRILEHNADIYGLEVIHGIVPNSQQAAAEAFQILGEVSLSDPNPSPLIEFWLYDHPPVGERVRFAAQYDPWRNGQPPRYVQSNSVP